LKILIAEDDKYILEGLQDLLHAEGYDTVAAADGQSAIDLFHSEAPHFVLLDIMMPILDGYAVCREIRKRDNNIPVIFISAKSEEIDRVLGLELGADDYIMKPFGTREVVARIRAVTRRCLALKQPGGDKNICIRLGDLEVYPDELRARRGEQKIDISLRDTRILQLLHRSQGKIVERDRLFNECWGQNYFPNSRTLDQHISKLRKLIEIDPQNPVIIRTVHGVGYRYE